MPAGPGKYEGQSARTFLLDSYMGSSSYDEIATHPGEVSEGAALFNGAWSLDDPESVKEAKEYGFTDEEIAEAVSEVENTLGGCILFWDDQGFVSSRLFPYGVEMWDTWRAIVAEYDALDDDYLEEMTQDA